MRKWTFFLAIILCCIGLPAFVQGEEYDPVGGLLNQVDHAVQETVSSVGKTVGDTLESTGETVIQTTNLIENTGKTIGDPTSQTTLGEDVGSVVQSVTSVVESEVGTVQTVTAEATGIVKEFPEVELVTPVVDETADFVQGTAERTLDFTTDTLREVGTPYEQPVRNIVSSTENFVGETLESTVPVVETTTETVQTVVEDVTAVTDIAPNVPLVTSVLEETTSGLQEVVGHTREAVDETVSTAVKGVAAPLKSTGAEREPVEQMPQPEQPIVAENENADAGQPEQKMQIDELDSPDTQKATSNSGSSSIPAVKPTEMKEVETAMEMVPAVRTEPPASIEEAPKTEIPEKVAETVNADADTEETIEPFDAVEPTTASGNSAGKQTEASKIHPMNEPLPEGAPGERIPNFTVSVSAGSSSITLIPASPGGTHADLGVNAMLADSLHWLLPIKPRWNRQNERIWTQWTHAPPGQPPQTAPFLYVNQF
ncbi:hypothetical protein MKY41_15505 [Sporosarcina sp. FSL W7-1349]|uniref:hypothetical protein n=1 Tax=Sporosarcina sp. FSL W7-1349 TaxID=2921561 RepID=UPI0030FC0E8D